MHATEIIPHALAANEAAVRALWDRAVDAWNRGDADAYAATFTRNSDYVAFDGTHFKGRHENARSHRELFDTWLKGSKLVGTLTDIRFVTPDVAIAHATGAVRLRWQRKAAPGRQSIQTLVAVRHGSEWRFEAFHNTRIQRRSWLQTLLMMLGRR